MMPVFIYSARSPSGEIRSGEVDLPRRDEVVTFLRRQRLVPLSIRRKVGGIGLVIGSGVSTREIVVFTRQLATMINAGVPLAQSLTTLGRQSENRIFRAIVLAVLSDVRAGQTLADSLRRHPKIFAELYVNMVAAGEAGGVLDVILLRLAALLEKSDALTRKLRAATMYPAVVLLVAAGATTILLWQVVPVFAGIFSDAGLALPTPTRVVLVASDFLQRYIHILFLASIALAIAARQVYRTGRGRLAIDQMLLRLPIAGPLIRKAAVSRLTRTLGTLVASGVSILEGLEITARTAGNRVVHDAVMRSRRAIAGGATISRPLAASGVFPPMVVQMIDVGEQTGALDEMLSKIADFYDDEVDAAAGALAAILEPIMIVFMGAVIGGIVVAIYLPMFDLIRTIQ